MFGVLTVLGSVGLICASGVAISSGLKWFHTYEIDITAKMKESKKAETKREVGGVDHELRMENLHRRIGKQ